MPRPHLISTVLVALLVTIASAACGSAKTDKAVDSARNVVSKAPDLARDVKALFLPGTARSNKAAKGVGDEATPNGGVPDAEQKKKALKWVQLTTQGRKGLGAAPVVNAVGLTLYSRAGDACDEHCTQSWVPVSVEPGGRVFIAGFDQSTISTVERSDGTLQLAIKGSPRYRYAKDTRPGETNGQADGGVQVSGGGGKLGDTYDPKAKPATSVVLFDDVNFGDAGASQSLKGPDCVNVENPGAASSVAADGRVKLWSGKDCAGRSVTISQDVADLGTLGLDDAVQSVRFLAD
jgi:predicted lipoprotein with Yx(FWY)xxD motif